jgi:hypothetical protein
MRENRQNVIGGPATPVVDVNSESSPSIAVEGDGIKSNTENLPKNSRGISFSAAGTLKVMMADGAVKTIPENSLSAGIIHPISVKRIYSTGTSVTDLVVYY